jgi:DeoR family fructose operon transcriptional repressor
MRAAERQIKIHHLIRTQEFIDAQTLASKLDVSESSLRRDLMELERQGLVRRVRGGAVSLQVQAESRGIRVAATRSREETQRIGRAAAALLEDGQTVIMDGGSTVGEVARQLLGHSLQLITNSILIAQIFSDSKSMELTLTGGYLYPRLGVLLGPICEEMLSRVAADVLVMGIGGITEAGLSNTNTLVVGSERKMIEVSRRVIVVADHSKFGRQAMAHLAPLEAVDTIVTDQNLPPRFEKLLAKYGVELIVAV